MSSNRSDWICCKCGKYSDPQHLDYNTGECWTCQDGVVDSNMYIKQPKIRIVLEIDQSRYLGDEDYPGIEKKEIDSREALGALLDGGYYDVTISIDKLPKKG